MVLWGLAGVRIDSVPSLLKGMAGELSNWPSTAPLGLLASPSRYLPSWNPVARSPLARRTLLLRLRNGLEIECKANEFPVFLEVFVTEAYKLVEQAGIRWPDVRNIVDIGANVGMATLWFSRKAAQASILAVEPAHATHRLLTVNIARNDLGERVTAVRAAVSDTGGTGRLASAGASVDRRLVDSEAGEEVATATLSALLDDHRLDSVDILKMDCEGQEFAIFSSAEPEDLRRVRCIVGEYHKVASHTSSDLKEMLAAKGFEASLHEEVPEVGIFLAVRR